MWTEWKYVIQRKSGIINEFRRKKLYDWSFCKDYYMWNFSTYDCECNKASKIDKYLDIKDCSWKKRVSGKSLLVCEN